MSKDKTVTHKARKVAESPLRTWARAEAKKLRARMKASIEEALWKPSRPIKTRRERK